jgi:hypothetical protein
MCKYCREYHLSLGRNCTAMLGECDCPKCQGLCECRKKKKKKSKQPSAAFNPPRRKEK